MVHDRCLCLTAILCLVTSACLTYHSCVCVCACARARVCVCDAYACIRAGSAHPMGCWAGLSSCESAEEGILC